MRSLHSHGLCICIWSEVHRRFWGLVFQQPSCMGRVGPSSEGVKFAYGTGEVRERSEGRVLDVFDGSIRPSMSGMSGKHGFSPLYGFE